jgi:hypothetical protein
LVQGCGIIFYKKCLTAKVCHSAEEIQADTAYECKRVNGRVRIRAYRARIGIRARIPIQVREKNISQWIFRLGKKYSWPA